MEKRSQRNLIYEYVKNQYNSEIEQLWPKYPKDVIFRNRQNKKWYGIIMEVSCRKVGVNCDGYIDVLNVKIADNLLKDFLIRQKGFCPAYHMSKEHWISILLDGSVDINQILDLIDSSYNIIDSYNKKRNKQKGLS